MAPHGGRGRGVLGALAVVGVLATGATMAAPSAPARPAAAQAAPAPPVGLLAVPDPLPAGAPGDVIASEPFPASGYPFSVELHQIVYLSTDRFGDPIAVAGVVAEPVGVPAPPGGRAAVAWGHGTTGMVDGCAPSLAVQVEGRMGAPWGIEAATASLAAGHVVVATDYPGLGTPGLHPYLDGVGAGRSMLDSLRAAQHFGAGPVGAVAGFSQGGHAAIYAGTEWGAGYAPDLDLRAVVPVAAPTFLSAAYAAALALPAAGAYVDLILAGIVAARPDLDAAQLLTPSGLAEMDRLAAADEPDGLCEWPAFDLDADVRADPLDLPAWRAALEANEPGDRGIPAPVLMVASEGDTTSLPFMTEAICTGLQGQGTDLRLWMYDDEGHVGTESTSGPDRTTWILDRLAGLPVTDAVDFTREAPQVITSCPFGADPPPGGVPPGGVPPGSGDDPGAAGPATPIRAVARFTG